MFTFGQAVSTSDDNQVKPAGKEYMNVKPVQTTCMCCDNVRINKKTQFICIYIYVYIYIYTYLNTHTYIHMYKNI